MQPNSAPANNDSSNDPDAYLRPSADFKPWYPSFRNIVITNERRPGRYTKREKRQIRASLLPVLPNPDDGKDYVLGGKYAKTPAQVDAEFAEQLKLEKAMREEEKRRMGIVDTSAAASSSAEESSSEGNGGGGAGRGRGAAPGVRLSYGGMRGIARGHSGFSRQ
ncbi:hypothetical protein niasHT_029991 [Heterodera trifolii]|uniref:Uncharacterized protein n=1 Tax=Heterodera trifolii TaxID=157864 RepID=A0ABD2JJP7_9BILA